MEIRSNENIEIEDKGLIEFIKKVLEGKTKQKEYKTINERIPVRLAEEIKRIVGFSVEDFGNEIDSGQMKHIWKEHGYNGRADSSMSDIKRLAQMGYVIENFEKIRMGKNKSKYKNSDGTIAKTIELQKKMGEDFYYVVEAVPNTQRKKLQIVSAYINRNDTFSEMAVSDDPCRYVRNESQPNVSISNNSIPNNT